MSQVLNPVTAESEKQLAEPITPSIEPFGTL
jgi:hypothetical protein